MRSYILTFTLLITLNVGVASDKTSDPSRVRLSGHVPNKAISQASFIEHLEPNTPVPVTFVLPLRNQKALEQLIQQIHNPADQQQYGKYLTSAEFTERFAPTQAHYEKVIAYAKTLGLTIIGTHPNRILLNVSGSSETIETAFKLNLNVHQQTNGRHFYAPDNDPEVSADIASTVNGIVGLDNASFRHAYNRPKKMLTVPSASTYPSGPGQAYAPGDIKIAYNLTGVSANGSGQTIALLELATYLPSDITAYTTYFGLPPSNLTNVLVDGGSGTGIDPEVALDIELALALAPESQIYVYEGPNSGQGVLDTYNRIATDNIAKQVSTSWGLGEDEAGIQELQAENAIFQQMAVQGQSIYSAAGDSGAYDDYPSTALIVDDPASQPYVVGVGGTSLTVNANTGAYTSETVWNDGVGNGSGGGGVSAVWPIPSWQTNVSTVYSKTNRNVPDISLNSDQDKGYSVFYDGQWAVYGGTSCAAPLWAAFTALVNQQRLANEMAVLGFPNPSLYAIGTTAATQAIDYHDITMGNNYFYQAGPGYDNASGWGSFNGANLFAGLTQPAKEVPLVNITWPANGATVSGTITITATATDPLGIATVEFYVDSTPIVSDTAAPYTATLNTTTLSNGQHTLTATAVDNGGNSAQSVVTITVNNVAEINYYINAGGSAHIDTCTGLAWHADEYYNGGQASTNTNLPSCLGVYRSERHGNFSYFIPVSNGAKYVILKFSENNFDTIGARVFDVFINGALMVANLDIYKLVGYAKPLDLSFLINVTTGYLEIEFINAAQNSQVNAIEILSK